MNAFYVERPDSTNIANLELDAGTDVMTVTFRNGSAYTYHPIGKETFLAIAEAPSAGKAFHHHIRRAPPGTFEVTKLENPVLQPPADGNLAGWALSGDTTGEAEIQRAFEGEIPPPPPRPYHP